MTVENANERLRVCPPFPRQMAVRSCDSLGTTESLVPPPSGVEHEEGGYEERLWCIKRRYSIDRAAVVTIHVNLHITVQGSPK